MSDSMPPLDPAVLDALREAEPASAEVRARARGRLMSALLALGATGLAAGAATGSAIGSAGGATGAIGTRAMGASAAKVAIAAFLLGGAVGATLYAGLVGAPSPRTVYVDRLVAAPAPAPLSANPATVVPSASPVVPAVPLPSAPTTAVTAPPGRASQLSAERVLLDEARAALAQGEAPKALDRLQRHRQAFAAPLLGEERDAMWVQALVKVGRYDDARARAAAFHKRWPDSLFASMVDSAVDAIP